MRRRSLQKDNSDFTQFRHGRDRHIGFSISNEYYQQMPFFFTRECAQLNLVGHYRGASAFMICNGPSLNNLNLNLLDKPGIITYGMNNGPKTFRPNLWTCVDSPDRFLKSIWLDPRIQKFVPHAHLEKSIFDSNTWEKLKINVGDCPNVIAFHRNEKFVADRFLFEDTINWGNHKNYGGGRTVMLPAIRILFILGFRKVYMLGADLNMDCHNTYHFDEQRCAGAVSGNRVTYNRLINEYFPQLKPYFDAEGFEVYNCNKDSNLTVFPYKPFEEAVFEATSILGNIEKERTYGLYGDLKKRDNMIIEPTLEEKIEIANKETTRLQKKENKKIFKPNKNDLEEFEKHRDKINKEMIESRRQAFQSISSSKVDNQMDDIKINNNDNVVNIDKNKSRREIFEESINRELLELQKSKDKVEKNTEVKNLIIDNFYTKDSESSEFSESSEDSETNCYLEIP